MEYCSFGGVEGVSKTKSRDKTYRGVHTALWETSADAFVTVSRRVLATGFAISESRGSRGFVVISVEMWLASRVRINCTDHLDSLGF